jgi:transcriptional regulator with XRE-family HTH domain
MPRVHQDVDAATLAVFGENVKSERKLRGWSLEKLAVAANMANDTVFRVEKGLPSTPRTRQRIANALQCSYYRLLLTPRILGDSYAIHRRDDDWWLIHSENRSYKPPQNEDELIQQGPERVRLGKLGFVRHFVRMFNCRLPKGKLVGGILELYGNGDASKYLAGEVFLYVMKGQVVLKVGEEEVFLDAGEAATVDCTGPEFSFNPRTPGSPAPEILYVRLDEGSAKS